MSLCEIPWKGAHAIGAAREKYARVCPYTCIRVYVYVCTYIHIHMCVCAYVCAPARGNPDLPDGRKTARGMQ